MSPVIPVAERMMTAVHEAGHAVVATMLGIEVTAVSLGGGLLDGWRHDGSGFTAWRAYERDNVAPSELMLAVLAGQEAERYYLEDVLGQPGHALASSITRGAESDNVSARQLMRELGEEAESLGSYERRTAGLVVNRWDNIVRLAEVLEERRRVGGSAVPK